MMPAHTLPRSNEGAELRDGFMRWQCRIRQMMMREDMGRPSDGITPEVTLIGESEPLGHVITVMCKTMAHSQVEEFKHMVRKTHDPAQRRDGALRLFSEAYYQKADTFSDILTSTFPPGSPGAAQIRAAERCTLRFEAFRQRYDVACKVWVLGENNPLHQATYWHNMLFNPTLPAETVILGFEPDWTKSSSAQGV
jgi:hypothetical protein